MKKLVDRLVPFAARVAINELMEGRTNAWGEVTLSSGATQTVLSDVRLSPTSAVFLSPMTANAAAELASGNLYIDGYEKGQCTIHHTNSAATDRTFRFVILTGRQ